MAAASPGSSPDLVGLVVILRDGHRAPRSRSGIAVVRSVTRASPGVWFRFELGGDPWRMTAQPVDQEIQGLERAVHTLTREFPRVPASEVRMLVAEMRGDFVGRPIREFVPLFVERKVRQVLKDRHTR